MKVKLPISQITKNNKALTKAAKIVKKDIDKHFKKDGWDLDYSFQVDEVFYEAYKEHLENYLVKELYKNPEEGYVITTRKKDPFRLIITKRKIKK